MPVPCRRVAICPALTKETTSTLRSLLHASMSAGRAAASGATARQAHLSCRRRPLVSCTRTTVLLDSDAGPFHGVILGRLPNDLCLGFALPTNVAGDKASCRIVLEGETSGCGHPGLQLAAAGDLAAI